MEQIQTNTVMVMAMVAQHLQLWLRKVLMWLIDEEGERTVKNIVNEESDDDEGYDSIIGTTEVEIAIRRRRKPRDEDLVLDMEITKEELKEKFILLRDSYDDLTDDMTRLEFEAERLKDDQDEREEEMRLRRSELLKLVELMKVMQEEKEGDKNIIRRQQEIIDSWAKEQSGACQGEDGTNNIIL